LSLFISFYSSQLKSGSFATVCKGTHRATGKKIAVKCVLREDLPPNDDAAIYDEVLILSTLKHPLICPLIDFFEERECYFLVMELMTGGDLFDRIGEKKNYTEQDARTLCKKMIESVCFCHENSVVSSFVGLLHSLCIPSPSLSWQSSFLQTCLLNSLF
jgi:serine/threonine protein kinase